MQYEHLGLLDAFWIPRIDQWPKSCIEGCRLIAMRDPYYLKIDYQQTSGLSLLQLITFQCNKV